MRLVHEPADFIHNPKRSKKNYRLFHEIVQHFTARNVIITVGLQDVPLSESSYHFGDFDIVRHDIQVSSVMDFPIPKLDILEPIYLTKFVIYMIPLLLLDYWTSPKITKGLHLSYYNQFIPDENRFSPDPNRCDSFLTHLSKSNSSIQMWMVRYQVTNIPNVHIKCEFRSGRADGSLRWSGKLSITVCLVLKSIQNPHSEIIIDNSQFRL